jgi:uncharacterized protein YndB with AHSA1/START domain
MAYPRLCAKAAPTQLLPGREGEHVNDAVTGMKVTVEGTVNAPPERVWDLLADVTSVPRWSPECVHTEWIEPGGPRVGARFVGTNRNDLMEWQVTCVIVECDRPHRLAWIVLDGENTPDRPSSRWHYELTPLAGGGTRIREEFEHGPGDSKLRWVLRTNPDWDQAAVVEFRRQRLHDNMTSTMAAMAKAAEAG